jgi:hypothetical protein
MKALTRVEFDPNREDAQ